MAIGQLQSHFQAAMKHLEEGSLQNASREAELAVDDFWKFGDPKIVQALPLFSMLRHATGVEGDAFQSLNDMPKSLSKELLSEANELHQSRADEASARMLADVNNFVDRWVGEQAVFWSQEAAAESKDEKIEGLIEQIEQLKAEGKSDLAVETALQLANEHVIRGNKRRAYGNFMQVLKKAKGPKRVSIRIETLLDFGQFMSQLGKLDDARRALRLAAGVAKKARDKSRFSQAVAALGVVLMHAGERESAKRCLKKADSMLSPWDLEADIVREHLEAIKEGKTCDCPDSMDWE